MIIYPKARESKEVAANIMFKDREANEKQGEGFRKDTLGKELDSEMNVLREDLTSELLITGGTYKGSRMGGLKVI